MGSDLTDGFAKRLKDLRIKTGLEQKEFAQKAGINYVQYNRYENGDRKPSAEILPKIATALEVSVDYLLEGNEENAAVANLADRDLLEMFQRTEKLTSNDKEHVKALLDAFISTREMAALLPQWKKFSGHSAAYADNSAANTATAHR